MGMPMGAPGGMMGGGQMMSAPMSFGGLSPSYGAPLSNTMAPTTPYVNSMAPSYPLLAPPP